jgi:hypothetical protein
LFGSTGSSEALSLGFANPNQPLLFLTIVAINGAFVFADSKYRRTYAMVMMALSTIIYLFTLSRTSYIALMIFLLIYFIGSIKTYKIISRTILVVLVFFTASSFIVATKYGEIGNPINDALTNRPYLWNLRVQDNAAFNLIGNKDRYEGSGAESALDNNYINLISRHGWVAYIIVFYFLLIWRKESDREYDEVYVLGLFCILVYFLSESMPFTLVLSIVPIISIQRKFLVSGENKI